MFKLMTQIRSSDATCFLVSFASVTLIAMVERLQLRLQLFLRCLLPSEIQEVFSRRASEHRSGSVQRE